jgi:hypothetical protein
VRGGAHDGNACPVCQQDECHHSPDRLFRVGVVAIIKEADLREVSLVSRPAHPGARLTAIPVDNADLMAHFRENYAPGLPLSCDKCLGNCTGFDELTEPGDSTVVPESGYSDDELREML